MTHGREPPGPARGPLCLGNDVVDLHGPRTRGRSTDRRLLGRVFSPTEREKIQASPDPDRLLWLFWAGKEAAFKTVTRLRGAPPVFEHHRFQVSFPEPDSPAPGSLAGAVAFEGLEIPLSATVTADSIHVHSWHPAATHEPASLSWEARDVSAALQEGGTGDWRLVLRDSFSPREWSCISHHGSALARAGARGAMAQMLEVAEVRLEIACLAGPPGRRPPTVLLDGAEAPLDLSLSHHGRFVAWVFAPR